MKELRFILAALTVASISATAFAQQSAGWLVDRSRREGPGIRVGNLELHPGIGAEVGYDSNVFLDSSDEPTLDPEGSLVFRISPHFDVSNIGRQRQTQGETQGVNENPPKVEFRFGVNGQVYIFLQDDAPTDVALNSDLDVRLFPRGPFSVAFGNHFTRRVRPFTQRAVGGATTDFGTDQNRTTVAFTGQSRGGVVRSTWSYTFGIFHLEDPGLRYANHFDHQVGADVHFRFLPSTSLFWDANVTFTNYYNASDEDYLTQSDSTRVRTRVGINGVVTPRFSGTVAVGYGAAFVDNDAIAERETFNADVQLRFQLAPTSKLSIGYDRTTAGSIVGNYRVQDRVSAGFQWLLGGSFLLSLDASAAHVDYGTLLITDSSGMPLVDGERKDWILNAQLFAEYRATNWLGINVTLGYTGVITDFEYPNSAMGVSVLDPAGFNKFEAWLGARVFY